MSEGRASGPVFVVGSAPMAAELRFHAEGLRPSHRVGYIPDLRALGFDARVVPCPPHLQAFFLRHTILWILFSNLRVALGPRPRAVIALQEHNAPLLLLLRRLRLFPAPIVQITVALVDQPRNPHLRRRGYRFLLAGADAVVAFASEQLPLLMSQFGIEARRLHAVRLGIDPSFYPEPGPADQRRPNTVLSLGINRGRDYLTIVRALLQLPSVEATLITDGRHIQELEQAHPDRPARIALRHSGVDPRELVRLYSKAAVGIVATRDVRFSIGQTVLLEMMASGCAVVATDSIPLRDYVEDGVTAVLVPAGDAAALREAVSGLLVDRSGAEALGSAASVRVRERYSSAGTAGQLAAVLETVSSRAG